MGQYGSIPARSPDSNLLYFFLWQYCKEKIYRRIPENVDDNDKLHYAIWEIEDGVMENIQKNLLRCMRACIEMDGGHFENLPYYEESPIQ